jgi:hypothetical protein
MRAVKSVEPAPLFVVALAVAAYGAIGAHAQTSASEQATGASRTAGQSAVATSEPLVLEFDLPTGFSTQPADSANAVTGFRVGFFQANDGTPIRTIDFTNEALTIRDRAARVTLPRSSIPEPVDNIVIRVRTLSGEQTSVWSDPVPLAGPSVRQVQPQATPRPPRLAPGDIERYVLLGEALRKLLPADVDIEAELGRFRRVADLALAVVLSRDYDIPFTTLSQTLEGPPRLPPRRALAKLRSDIDAAGAVRKARPEARRLIETMEPKK